MMSELIKRYLLSISSVLFIFLGKAAIGLDLKIEEKLYVDPVPEEQEYILGADIGGTNSRFGIFSVSKEKKLTLLLTLKTDSQQIVNFSNTIKHLLDMIKENHGITIKQACIGAPGPTSPHKDYSKSYWMPSAIDAKDIIKNTGLEKVIIINDFEIVGYGIDLLQPSDLIELNKGSARPNAPKVILGAGTGLGTALMIWNEGRYVSLGLGGGLLAFAPQTPTERDMTDYLKSVLGKNVSWGNILSGSRGIPRIYSFLETTGRYNPTMTIEETHPAAIFNNRTLSPRCQDTVDLFMHFYARFVREFALLTQSYGGLYIAGGVAAKNVELFQKFSFLNDVLTSESEVAQNILKQTPMYVIADPNVSLYGAAQYLLLDRAEACQLPY